MGSGVKERGRERERDNVHTYVLRQLHNHIDRQYNAIDIQYSNWYWCRILLYVTVPPHAVGISASILLAVVR